MDGAVDGTQSTDGLAVLDRPMGAAFPGGLPVTQDGEDTPGEPGRESTNFKLVDWSKVIG